MASSTHSWSTQSSTAWSGEEVSDKEPDDTLWTPEPIVAYRGWEWDTNPKEGGLKGAFGSWETSTLIAVHEGEEEKHSSPDWDCLCGINAYKDPIGARGFPIIGMIELTGLVIEYETGYRGAVGTIKHLSVWEGYFKMRGLTIADIRNKYPDVVVTSERKIPWRTKTPK